MVQQGLLAYWPRPLREGSVPPLARPSEEAMKLTPKERVLKALADAECVKSGTYWRVWWSRPRGKLACSRAFESPAAAWADAANRIKGEKRA